MSSTPPPPPYWGHPHNQRSEQPQYFSPQHYLSPPAERQSTALKASDRTQGPRHEPPGVAVPTIGSNIPASTPTTAKPASANEKVEFTAAVAHGLTLGIHESLQAYVFVDAIDLAGRLYDLQPNPTNLHLLAHCYVVSGDVDTAYRLLQQRYPFFETHATRQRHQLMDSLLDSEKCYFSADVRAMEKINGAVLPIDARRVLVPPPSHGAAGGADAGAPSLAWETVDLKPLWDCQYLYGVCCTRTSHFSQGATVLAELVELQKTLEKCAASLRKSLQHEQQKLTEEEVVLPEPYRFIPSLHTASPVNYWLGICDSHRKERFTAEIHFRRAYVANPLRIDAFHQYIDSTWTRAEDIEKILLCSINNEGSLDPLSKCFSDSGSYARARREVGHRQQFHADPRGGSSSAGSSPSRGGLPMRTAASPAASSPSAPPSPSSSSLLTLSETQRLVVRRYLNPFLKSSYLSRTYKCRDALKELAVLVQNFPTSMWVLRCLALAHFHNGDFEQSAEVFARLLHCCPWNLQDPALVYYSTALWHLKYERDLSGLAQRLVDDVPLSPTTLCIVANAYSLINNRRDALAMLQRAVQMAPQMAYAHALYGYELLAQDRDEEAEAAFKAALAMDRHSYIAYAGLGERTFKISKNDLALVYYRDAAELNPTPAVMQRYALAYLRRGGEAATTTEQYHALKSALEICTQSVQNHPDNIPARRQLAMVLLRLGNLATALEQLVALVEERPADAGLHVMLAECYARLDRFWEAQVCYEKVLHLNPSMDSYVQGCLHRLKQQQQQQQQPSSSTM